MDKMFYLSFFMFFLTVTCEDIVGSSSTCNTNCAGTTCKDGKECQIFLGCALCLQRQTQIVPSTINGTCYGNCNGITCDEGKTCKVITSCAQCVSSDKEKPGKCSKWKGNLPCMKTCDKDFDCPTTRKCCSLGCTQICTDPCATSCELLPPCLAGTECRIVDSCAECVAKA